MDDSCPTKIFNDSFSGIQNCQNSAADLSKKHVAVSFHLVREAIAAGIVAPYWLKGEYKISDIMTTKQISKTPFKNHCKNIFWHPDFHFYSHNKLNELTVSNTSIS